MKQYFAINRHDNLSKGSLLFGNHLFNYCYSKLIANDVDPEIAAMAAFLLVQLSDWNEGYAAWRAAALASMGATRSMKLLNKQLMTEKAPAWIVKIWSFYPEGSEKAVALIPHGRQDLITGPNLNHKVGMETLIAAIGSDTNLAALKTEMQTFVDSYVDAMLNQSKAQKLLKDLSKAQELLRVDTAEAMLCVEGSLIKKYYKTSNLVDDFFDVSAMRRRHGKKITDDGYQVFLLPDEIKLLETRFTGTEKWIAENLGTEPACLFFSKTMDASEIPQVKYEIPVGGSVPIDLSQVPSNERFVYAANLSSENDAQIKIRLSK